MDPIFEHWGIPKSNAQRWEKNFGFVKCNFGFEFVNCKL